MIERLILPGMGVNCYIFYREDGTAFIVDPGLVHKKIDDFVKEKDLKVQAILLTHGHGDHIMGVEHYQSLFDCPVYAHREERVILEDHRLNHSRELGGQVVELKNVSYFDDDVILYIGGIKVQTIFTPGHSPGGVSYLTDEGLFSGDTLFKLGIGRYDLYAGDLRTLETSIRKLYELEEDTPVFPGHGVTTSIGYEMLRNPHVRK